MIPIEQKQPHDPDNNNIKGDCFSATLASLLHIPLEDIPVFDNVDGEAGSWLREVNKFLAPYGLAFVIFTHIDSFKDIFKFTEIKDFYHECAGDSPRFPGTGHSCVAKDFKIIHDPHPTKLGLPEVSSIGVFIALQPWRFK